METLSKNPLTNPGASASSSEERGLVTEFCKFSYRYWFSNIGERHFLVETTNHDSPGAADFFKVGTWWPGFSGTVLAVPPPRSPEGRAPGTSGRGAQKGPRQVINSPLFSPRLLLKFSSLSGERAGPTPLGDTGTKTQG